MLERADEGEVHRLRREQRDQSDFHRRRDVLARVEAGREDLDQDDPVGQGDQLLEDLPGGVEGEVLIRIQAQPRRVVAPPATAAFLANRRIFAAGRSANGIT